MRRANTVPNVTVQGFRSSEVTENLFAVIPAQAAGMAVKASHILGRSVDSYRVSIEGKKERILDETSLI